MASWSLTESDQALAEDLRGFVPDRVFDAHAHVYRAGDLGENAGNLIGDGPREVSIDLWRAELGKQMPGAELRGGLFIPYPTATTDNARANAFLLAELEKESNSRGLLLVAPDSDRSAIEAQLAHPQIVGFKPYHCYAPGENTFEAPLDAYLPEWVWDMANAGGYAITLHMVRHGALSDPGNLAAIRENCRKYPNAKLILAHAARGFHSPNTVRSIGELSDLQNVWFDTSAICEAAPLLAILKEFGPRRLLWGSDFTVSQMRGRCVTVGDGFLWVGPEHGPGSGPAFNLNLVGLESLRALRDAADLFALNADDVQDIFHDNAQRLLGMPVDAGVDMGALHRHAKDRMPGGTQLLSKRPELMAPEQWPAYFREARGCETWDLEGRHYYDMSMAGIGASVLGFRDSDVTRAVQRRINLGSWCTLNPPEEVEVADRLCTIHPWAENVRFTRTGGESAAVAVRIARATTGRSKVAICGYHGWHDWYLAANLGEDDSLRGHLLPGLQAAGVPSELRGTAHTFTYNNREQLQAVLDAHGDELAAVVMEPCRYQDPDPGFLEFVRDGAHKHGALLIFDEITIGWRRICGGAHLRLGVNPDLAMFAKSLGNGHPIGAVIGTREAMDGAHDSFISSAYWTESVGPAAALAVLDKMARVDVPAHVDRIGQRVLDSWKRHGAAHKLPLSFDGGYPCLAHFAFDHEQATALRTLFSQLMLERGFLAGTAISCTLGHTEAICALYDAAVDEVFAELAQALSEDSVEKRLKGPLAHSGFARLL